MTRILAIDYGTKRVGLALSDPTGTLATGLRTLEQGGREKLLETVGRLVHTHEVGEVLIGLPLNMDGTRGPRAREVERFADHLRERLRIPVTLRDERLSTVRAYRILRESGVRARAGKARADRLAAVLILQGYLDAKAGSHAEASPGSEGIGTGGPKGAGS